MLMGARPPASHLGRPWFVCHIAPGSPIISESLQSPSAEVADNTWGTGYAGGSADSNNTIQGQIGDNQFSARKANAVRAYYEWMPIRQTDTDDKLRIWRSFSLGKLGSMIMLDTRSYDRSVTDLYYNTDEIRSAAWDEDRTMTGSKQENWFFDELKKVSTNDKIWSLVMQQTVFASVNYTVATAGCVVRHPASPCVFAIADGDPSLLNTARTTSTSMTGMDIARSATRFSSSLRRRRSTTSSSFLEILTRPCVLYLPLPRSKNRSAESRCSRSSQWVSDLKRENSTIYNATTGEGSLGVEFAGSAVSSPSSFGYGPKFTDGTCALSHLRSGL